MTTIEETVSAEYLADWNDWHGRRLRATTEAYGIASGIGTDWLSAAPRTFDHLPGSWRLEDGVVVGEGIPLDAVFATVPDRGAPLAHGGTIRLGIGEAVSFGRYRIVGFKRVDDRGIRTYDPLNEKRTSLVELASFDLDPRFTVRARLERAPEGATLFTDQTDGGRVRRTHIGDAVFELDGREHRLTVTAHHTIPGRGFASFSDLTSGVSTSRFRFLEIVLPEGGSDQLELDFNRAFLPPASFHESYSCPLPLDRDRFDVEITAGERTQVYASV
jgi:uncharacterized protein (DUF1684 family)